MRLCELARCLRLLSDPKPLPLARKRFLCFALRSTIQLSSPPGLIGRLAVGQARFELATPRLSSVCSNQLSYWPVRLRSVSQDRIASNEMGIDRNVSATRGRLNNSRKEVIQPQVPLRLPCYDFTPVTSHSLGGYLTRLAHRLLEQLTPMV